MMPVMDGLEFCRLLKGDLSTSHIPVVLLTARTLEKQRAEGYATGADSYITKPFAAETLLARVANLLKSRVQLRRMFTGTTTEQEEQEALSAKDQTFVEQLRKTIKSHIPDANYSVEDLGEEMGLSRVQLYRKVRRSRATRWSTCCARPVWPAPSDCSKPPTRTFLKWPMRWASPHRPILPSASRRSMA